MPNDSTSLQMFVTVALNAWDQWSGRAGRLFDSITDERMMQPMAPGKNRPIYLLGHLIAVDDAMTPQLRLGEPAFPEYRETFLTQPDGAVAELPSLSGLRENWMSVHSRLTQEFKQLTPEQWLERHSTVSEEDFAKEPHRNRMALLHSRTAHLGYHIGQLLLFKA